MEKGARTKTLLTVLLGKKRFAALCRVTFGATPQTL